MGVSPAISWTIVSLYRAIGWCALPSLKLPDWAILLILFDRLIGFISTNISTTLLPVPCRAQFGTSYQWLWGRWQGLCWCDTSFWFVACVIPNRFIQHIVYLIDPLVSGRSTSYWFFLPQNYKITAPFITATYSWIPILLIFTRTTLSGWSYPLLVDLQYYSTTRALLATATTRHEN